MFMEESELRNLKNKLEQSKTFCILPWIHLHVMPDSTAIPCCVAPYEDVFGDLKTQTMEDIWNSPKYIELRRNMLAGKSSKTCTHCYDVEKSGFSSLRNSSWERFHHNSSIVGETEISGTLPVMKMKYIDIRFSNLCNFKCMGCSPTLSSSWYADHQILYEYKSDKAKVLSVAEDAPVFWKRFKKLVPDAEEIYFGGGEPLITKEHFEVLQLLIAENRTQINLSYNTNLSTLTYGRWNLGALWDKFQNVTLGISIDDIGHRAEYFRSGTKWGIILENFRVLKQNHPRVKRYINCTVSWVNAYYIPELYDFLIQEKIINPYDFNVNLLLDPIDLTLQALPNSLKMKTTQKLKKFQARLILDTDQSNPMFGKIQNIIQYMNSADRFDENKSMIQKRILKLDEIRNTSFKKTYPELADILIMD